jgi:hypothetical protein
MTESNPEPKPQVSLRFRPGHAGHEISLDHALKVETRVQIPLGLRRSGPTSRIPEDQWPRIGPAAYTRSSRAKVCSGSTVDRAGRSRPLLAPVSSVSLSCSSRLVKVSKPAVGVVDDHELPRPQELRGDDERSNRILRGPAPHVSNDVSVTDVQAQEPFRVKPRVHTRRHGDLPRLGHGKPPFSHLPRTGSSPPAARSVPAF